MRWLYLKKSVLSLGLAVVLGAQSVCAIAAEPVYHNPAIEIIGGQIDAYANFSLQENNVATAGTAAFIDSLQRQYSQSLAQVLTGYVPPLMCQNGQLYIHDKVPPAFDAKSIESQWERLVASDFVLLSILMDLDVLEKSITNEKNTPVQKQQSCTAYQQAVEALVCFQQQGPTCAKTYLEKRLALPAFDLPIESSRLRTLFAEIRPFFAYVARDKVTKHIRDSNDADQILKTLPIVLVDLLKQSIEEYSAWKSAEQLMLFLVEEETWLLEMLGLDAVDVVMMKKLKQRIAKEEKALLDYMKANAADRKAETLGKLTTVELAQYYAKHIAGYKQFRNKVTKQLAQLRAAGELYTELPADLDVDTARQQVLRTVKNNAAKIVTEEANKRLGLYIDLQLNGKISKTGRGLNTATLHLISQIHQQSMSIPECLSGESCQAGGKKNPMAACDKEDPSECPKALTGGEVIDLGITIDNVLQEVDGSYGIYCPAPGSGGGSCFNTATKIAREKIIHIFEALEIPLVAQIAEGAEFVVDADFKNLAFDIPFKPFPGVAASKPIRVELVKDGAIADLETLAKSIAEQVRDDVIKPAVDDWLATLPFVSMANEAVESLFATVIPANATITVELIMDEAGKIPQGFTAHVPVSLSSINPDLAQKLGMDSYTLPVTVNQSGVYVKPDNIPKALFLRLQEEARAFVKTLLPMSALEGEVNQLWSLHVAPEFESARNNLELGFVVSYSLDVRGCKLTPSVTVKAPFKDIEFQLAGLYDSSKKEVETCIRNKAIAEATKIIVDREIKLFGIVAKIEGQPAYSQDLSSVTLNAQLTDSKSGVTVKLKGISGRKKGTTYSIDFRTIDWNHDDASVKIGQIVEHRLKKIFYGDSEYFDLQAIQLSRDGFSFELLLHKIPYIGSVNLGRLYLNAITDTRLDQLLKDVLRPALTAVINNKLKENVDIPDLGPIEDIKPEVTIADKVRISAKAKLALYGDVKAPVSLNFIPDLSVDIPDGKQVGITALNSLLGDLIPVKIGNTFTFDPPPTTLEYFPNLGTYGVAFGFEIDVNILKVGVKGAKITPKKIMLPDAISAQLGVAIPIPPFIVIANPGFTYYINKKGLTIDGEVTIVQQDIAKIVQIDSKLGLKDIEALTFTLDGDLIVASSLSLFSAEGKISLKDKIVSYRAGTNQLLKSIVDARGDGALDGKELQAYNQSSLRLLGIRLLENRLILEVPPSKKISDGTFKYHSSKRMLFGDLSLNLGTDLGFRNPSAEGRASIELGGWDAMSGKLSLDLYRAILEFEALGIDITVIAPSVKSISPSLLLNILADLLKIDIKALLEMDLDKIVINLMDPGGGIDQQKNKDDDGEDDEEREQEETCPDGTPRPCDAPTPVPVPPPPPPIPCTEGCQDPVREEEPGKPGYFACLEQLPSRYEFDRVYGTHEVKGHRHSGTLQQLVDWHPVTFGKAEYSKLCSGYELNGAWKPVMARQRINYNQYHDYQCDDENRMNIPVEAHKKATWNEDGHGYFCGTVPIGDSQSYQQVRHFELDTVSYDEWETLYRKRKHFVSDVYQRKLITEFNKLVPEFAQYGKAKRNHDLTRLTFERDCYVGWNCDRKVFLEVFFEPPSQLHTWRQAFQLFYRQDKFWYLSMCEDTKFMRNKAGLDITEPAYQKYCKTVFREFGTTLDVLGKPARVQELKDQATAGKLWLEAPEYYFLFEKRAVQHFLGKPMDDVMADSFLLKKDGKNYNVQVIKASGTGEPPIELYIYSKDQSMAAKTITIESHHPLYKWMEHDYRLELVKRLMDTPVLTVLDDDYATHRLVLVDEESLEDSSIPYVKTTWFAYDEATKKVNTKDFSIDRANPYTGGELVLDEYQSLVGHQYKKIITTAWTQLDFGIDKSGKYDIAIFSNATHMEIMLAKLSGNKRVLDYSKPAKEYKKRVQPLQVAACLAVGSTQDVLKVLTDPETYYPTLKVHPFDKLDDSRCQ